MNSTTLRRGVGVVAASALALTLAGCSLFGGAPRDDSGQLTAAASLALSDLQPGDCIDDVNALPESVTRVPAVSCSTTHNGEVFAVTTTGATYLQSVAESFCLEAFTTYIGKDYEPSSLDVVYFSPPNAAAKDKTLTCIAYHKDGATDNTSLKGSKQ